jgi:hypothetical protein
MIVHHKQTKICRSVQIIISQVIQKCAIISEGSFFVTYALLAKGMTHTKFNLNK